MNKLYIIAGPNGAGKTTASLEYLESDLDCIEFVNADNIASGISPFRPENVAVSAGKIMLARIDELIRKNVDFAIETTLSSKIMVEKIRTAKSNNFSVSLLFYWLDKPELAIKRVASRVESGGHNIPSDVVFRRYHRGLNNFFKIYRLEVDYWLMINNSGLKPYVIAEGTINEKSIKDINIWRILEENYDKRI